MQKNTLLLSNIQMLRALAAIAVLLHHAYPHYEAMGGNLTGIRIVSQWGFLGVDIFFVISGFIMAYTTFHKERTWNSTKTFLKHRLYRIYLGYWPFFIAMLGILFIFASTRLSNIDIFGSFFLINADMYQLVLPISWSLSYELYFYFLFVFTFLFSVKQLYIVIPIVILSVLCIVLYSFFTPKFENNFFISPFLLEFFFGVLLYMYKDFFMKSWLIPITILITIIAYNYGITYETKNGLYRVLTFGTGALFIVLTALILEQNHLYRTGKIFESLGDASYTLYLAHLIILELFYLIGLRNRFISNEPLLPLLGLSLVILISIIFSLIYYKFIEKPIYKKAIKI